MKKYLILIMALCIMILTTMALADTSRFTVAEPVSGEYTVTDAVTSLIWQKSYVGSKNWQEALAYCENLDYADQTDWRLPNKKELMSLVYYRIHNPASYFPDMQSSPFWSSSSLTKAPVYAWYVNFGNGDVLYKSKTGDTSNARCVRSVL